MPIDAGDQFALGDDLMRQTTFCCELGAGARKLALAQSVQQVAGEYEPLALSARQSLREKMFGARFHRVVRLAAKAGLRQGDLLLGDEAPIEPGRARRMDLVFDGEIGAHSEDEA